MATPPSLTEVLAEVRQLENQLDAATATVATRNQVDEALVAAKRVVRRGLFPLLVAVVLVVVLLGVIIAQRHVLNEIKSCTTSNGACYKRLASDPRQAQVITALTNAIVDDLGCVLLIQPAQRSQATLDACKAKTLAPHK